jgi:hypothetical protein
MSESNNRQAKLSDQEVERQIRRMTRRSFAWGAVASVAGLTGWGWLRASSPDNGISSPLRRMLELNERLARGYFKSSRLAPSFAREIARMPRVNGLIGLGDEFDPTAWALHVKTPSQPRPLRLTLDEIKALPRVEMVTELKCIEGWSDPVHWAGARLADFALRFRLATRSGNPPAPDNGSADLFSYVTLSTPNDDYYVGLDIESALHPQTLLCYEMNGQPLTEGHGAPLRLVSSVKYGYKCIKRIGVIELSDNRPADYWAERGYDWYAGH